MRLIRSASPLLFVLTLVLAPRPVAATPWTLTTLPLDGLVGGAAGTTIGWGYEIFNPLDNNWLVVFGIDVNAPAAFGDASVGVFDYPILAPGESRVVPYAPGLAGLLEWTWFPGVPVGTVVNGTAAVSAEFWTGDPYLDGAYDSDANPVTTVFTARVPEPPPTAVPEPTTLTLVAVGLLTGAWIRRRRKS